MSERAHCSACVWWREREREKERGRERVREREGRGLSERSAGAFTRRGFCGRENTHVESKGECKRSAGKKEKLFLFFGGSFLSPRTEGRSRPPRSPPGGVYSEPGTCFLWTMPAEVKQVRPAVICGAQLEPHILRSPQPFNPSTTFLALRYSLCLCLCLSLSLYLHPSLSPFL